MILRAAALCLPLAGPALALDLALPATARLTVARDTDPDRYLAPVGVFAEGQVAKVSVDGAVRRAAWRLDLPGLTPLQVMRPLRTQIEDAGYDIVLDCVSAECGGFDFRFATETLPGPNMYVNIRAFQFVTGLRAAPDGTTKEVITVLASTSATSAYVQIIQAGQAGGGELAVTRSDDIPVTTQPITEGDTTAELLRRGHQVLDGLDFETGSSDLGKGPFDALEKLGGFLTERPNMRIALVGHTDSVGGLDGNIALSRQRARSVRQRLIDAYGIAADRLEAEGMGYLSPLASNLTAEGRDANRRVEAILLSED